MKAEEITLKKIEVFPAFMRLQSLARVSEALALAAGRRMHGVRKDEMPGGARPIPMRPA
jgi:hypothetical protein